MNNHHAWCDWGGIEMGDCPKCEILWHSQPYDEKEFEAFKAMFLTVGVFARLAEQCGPYIGRLSNEDREFVISVALDVAWTGREDFNPARHTLLYWWDDCLRNTMKTRKHWLSRFRNGVKWVATEKILNWRDEDGEG